MAREKFYRYEMKNPNGKLPRGFIRMEDNSNVAVFSRLLRDRDVEKYNLVDLNDFHNLTKIRVSKGIKQADLAEMSGVSVRTIQGWELNGMNKAYLAAAVKVADALHVNIKELIEPEEE